jgi:O-antigen ligase
MFFKIFIIFYCYIVIRSLFYSLDFSEIRSIIFYIRFGVFSIFIYFLCDLNKEFTKNFSRVIFFFILFLIFDAFIQYHFGYDIFGIKKYSVDRISGVFGNDAKLGSYIARLFPLSLIYFFFNNSKKNNIFDVKYFLFLILVFIGILITGERTALFLFLLSILLIFIINKIFLKKIFLYFISFAIFFFIFVKFDSALNQRMIVQTKSQLNITGEKTKLFSNDHENHYLIAYKMFQDNILFGQGPTSFRHMCSKDKFKLENNLGCTTHPHNIYIQSLAEIGLVGFSFLFFYFIFVYWNIIKSILNNYNQIFLNNNFNIHILAVTISLSLFPLVPTGNLFNNWMSIIFYLPIGFFLNNYFKLK